MISIGIQHKDAIIKQVDALLQKHLPKIDMSYTNNENELSVSMTVKLQPNRTDGTDITTNLSFVESKVKDSNQVNVPDRQKQLFESVEKLRPKKEDGIDSITISSEGRAATLKAT